MDSFENISDCSNYISSTIMYRVVSKLSTNKIIVDKLSFDVYNLLQLFKTNFIFFPTD